MLFRIVFVMSIIFQFILILSYIPKSSRKSNF